MVGSVSRWTVGVGRYYLPNALTPPSRYYPVSSLPYAFRVGLPFSAAGTPGVGDRVTAGAGNHVTHPAAGHRLPLQRWGDYIREHS
jgi:hypothetical protein